MPEAARLRYARVSRGMPLLSRGIIFILGEA
jgi:hypothetical protein